MQKLPLLMTASVNPRGMNGACFTALEREEMYLETLMHYKNILPADKGYKIVFAENSGWDLTRLKSLFPMSSDSSIEFHSFAPEEFEISKGKGYNELLLINKTVDRSHGIRSANGFMKVTGRYPIYNVRYFLDRASDFILRGGGIVHRHKRSQVI